MNVLMIHEIIIKHYMPAKHSIREYIQQKKYINYQMIF